MNIVIGLQETVLGGVEIRNNERLGLIICQQCSGYRKVKVKVNLGVYTIWARGFGAHLRFSGPRAYGG